MNCRRTRSQLIAEGALDGAVRSHLETCSRCAAFYARLERVADMLQERAEVRPPGGFSSRVVAALEPPESVLTWASVRILPATLALAVTLALWSWIATPTPSTLIAEAAEESSVPSEDAVRWILNSRSDE